MSKSSKVEVQKGPIECSMPTSKFQTHQEKLAQANFDAALRRSGSTLSLHEPKKSRK